jgi:poly-gamma-glutamate synthesis protein (capsule biosynthesis protein)
MNYIWGDAMSIWQQKMPDLKMINLETAITQNDTYWPRKGINYRMHPRNVDILHAAHYCPVDGYHKCTPSLFTKKRDLRW